jgi:tetratricopeptide (TPR) repeat protein
MAGASAPNTLVKPDRNHPLLRRLALCLVIAGAVGALAGLWWTGSRVGINFLPDMAQAKWIIYPVVPEADARRDLELPTAFEDSFVLAAIPQKTLLRIAGFHRYTLAINGASPGKPRQAGTSWKQPDVFDVAGLLRAGANRIEVTVFNSDGPPALWLSLDAGALQVASGEQWRASYAGAAWCAAVPASAPKLKPGSYSYGLSRPLAALGTRWPTLLGFALLSCMGCWLLHKMGLTHTPDSNVPSTEPTAEWRYKYRETLPVIALAGFWLFFFANNIATLPYLTGFDAQSHVDYVRYIEEHHALPTAGQGAEMFQPPLYYLLSAMLLKLLHLSVSDASGIAALRLLGLVTGIAHFVVVWAALRLLFPAERSKAGWGVVMAACLPPTLFLSQYITNEGFAAMLVSGCVWLTLRMLKQKKFRWKSCVALGLCLGSALLAKSTALLVLPPIFGALLWKWLEKRTMSPAQWAARMGLVVALCALVGGWHYARLWVHYGSPLIGNWNPKLGYSWWQDDGYRTSAFYLRFGGVLVNPWSATFQGCWDGFYATLWGDGLLCGATNFLSRPPWNYDLMAVDYWLALLPTLAVLTGWILVVIKFVRQPSAEWFLLLGFSCLVVWALGYMSLVVPAHSQLKAFYGLSALIPFCAVGAVGLDFLAQRNTIVRSLVCITFGLWAINTCACYWISRSSDSLAIDQVRILVRKGQYVDAADILKERLRSNPPSMDLQFSLAFLLTTTGRVDEAARLAEMMVREHPDDCRGHHVLALALAHRQQPEKAIDEICRIMALAPGYDPSWKNFGSLLIDPEHPDETISMARQALASSPFSPELRVMLGSSLLFTGQENEASNQFCYACLLNPESTDMLADLAWKLATNPSPAGRNGPAAVKLAEQSCALTGYHRRQHMIILAAAYAESARFPEAVDTAGQAQASAKAAGDSNDTTVSQQLIDLFKTRQPYREIPRSAKER